jgi:hypothetical protein
MNDRPSLDDQMADAVRNQREHVRASMAVDRRGWTRQQWIDDARRLMHDLDGSVLALVNGHVMALLDEVGDRTPRSVATQPAKRYALVQDDDCHWYVVEADRVDEWYELDDDQINAGQPWMRQVGGAPNQVTFTDPLIFGKPFVQDEPGETE